MFKQCQAKHQRSRELLGVKKEKGLERCAIDIINPCAIYHLTVISTAFFN